MLSGIPPFYDDNIDKIFENIKIGEYKFPKRINFSHDSKDLINQVIIIFIYYLLFIYIYFLLFIVLVYVYVYVFFYNFIMK